MYEGLSGVVMKVSLKPSCSLAYSWAIVCIVLITAPLAARDNSQETSRGSISPSGSIATAEDGAAAPRLAPQAPSSGAASAAVLRARNCERLICMVFLL